VVKRTLFDIESNTLFYSLTKLTTIIIIIMSPSNSNNKSGSSHNRYIVPATGPSTGNKCHLSDDEVQLTALAARVTTARINAHKGKIGHQVGYIPHALCRSATMPARASAPAASGSKSSSNRASNGSKNMRIHTCYSDHICRGPVIQLPKADKPGKASTGGIAHKNLVQEQSATFREALTKDSFPPLVPGHFLKDARDCKNNAGPSSFLNMAAKGCKPGAKYTPRSPSPPPCSWCETSTTAKDWLPVSENEKDICQWRLGAGFRAQYGTSREVYGEVDGMASGDGAFGTTWMGVEEQVNSWLASLYKNSIPAPDTIEFINAYGQVDKMYQLPKKTKTPQRVSKKSSSPPPSPPKPFRTSSLEFPSRKTKKDIKGKKHEMTSAEKDKVLQQIIKLSEELEEENNLFKQTVKTSDEEDKLIKELINVMSENLCHATKTPKLDKAINQALVGDTWYNPPKFINNNHPVDLVPAKALPHSTKVKLLNKHCPIQKQTTLAQRKAVKRGRTFTVNIEKFGQVNHSPEYPVWEIPGFCYLAAITTD
jgi:hypothetical protein